MINVAQILKNLAAFCSVKGVQPDELVTAIFEKEYKKIETYKVNCLIYFIMDYSEKLMMMKHLFLCVIFMTRINHL